MEHAAERKYGYTRDEVLGRPVAIINVPDDVTHMKNVAFGWEREEDTQSKGGGSWSGELPFRRKDGTIGVSDTIIFSFLDDGGKLATIGINCDITELKQAQDVISAARDELLEKNKALEPRSANVKRPSWP